MQPEHRTCAVGDDGARDLVENEVTDVVLDQVGSEKLVFFGHSQPDRGVNDDQEEGGHDQRPAPYSGHNEQLDAQEIAIPALRREEKAGKERRSR